jgi:hypothetical protein
MISVLAASGVRRLPALLLVACLLVTGMPVVSAPAHDDSGEGMRAHAPNSHAQVVRAPALRPGTQTGVDEVASPAGEPTLSFEWRVREDGYHAMPVAAPRALPRPFHLSRAPPLAG